MKAGRQEGRQDGRECYAGVSGEVGALVRSFAKREGGFKLPLYGRAAAGTKGGGKLNCPGAPKHACHVTRVQLTAALGDLEPVAVGDRKVMRKAKGSGDRDAKGNEEASSTCVLCLTHCATHGACRMKIAYPCVRLSHYHTPHPLPRQFQRSWQIPVQASIGKTT
jgi:hypothetical protein